MATVTIPSSGGTDFVVYADVPTADAYMLGAFGAVGDAWRAAVTDDKSRALVSATRTINSLTWSSGYPSDTAWLAAIVNASIELAASILDGSLAQQATQAASGTKMLKAESVLIEYFRSLTPYPPSMLPPAFISMMSQWLDMANTGSVSGSASYGVDRCSTFDQSYETSRGIG